jgi:ferredoxin
MTRRVDPNLLDELKAFGAASVEQCVSCGNCTAICPLSRDGDRFPRGMIRMVQLGLKDELLGSRDLWLCFNCGECSETCPQQAEPANLMAAARCYAIAQYSPLRIGRVFSRPLLGSIVTALMVLVFGLFVYSRHRAAATDALRLFGFIPYPFIHDLGLAVIVLVAALGLVTVARMISRIARIGRFPAAESQDRGTRWLRALWDAVAVQSLAQKRYRDECEARGSARAWYLSTWFVHAATMWGFLGLLLATVLDYLLDIAGLKPTGTFVPLWYPTRLLGTLSGLLFMYGITLLLSRRLRGVDKAHSLSRAADWIFLALLAASGVTGFIVEVALYLPGAPAWGYWVFVLHVAVSITLLLLLSFTKFAHAIHRTVALYVEALAKGGRTEPVTAGTE